MLVTLLKRYWYKGVVIWNDWFNRHELVRMKYIPATDKNVLVVPINYIRRSKISSVGLTLFDGEEIIELYSLIGVKIEEVPYFQVDDEIILSMLNSKSMNKKLKEEFRLWLEEVYNMTDEFEVVIIEYRTKIRNGRKVCTYGSE